MSHNLEYLLTRPGALKIMTVIFGLVGAILSGHSYEDSPYTDFYHQELTLRNNTKRLPGTEMEMYNLTSTFVFLGISFFYLVAHSVFYAICESRLNKFIDTAFHMCGALMLFAGGTTLIFSAVHIEDKGCPEFEVVVPGKIPKNSPLLTLLAVLRRPGSQFNNSSWRNIPSQREEVFCHYLGEKIVAGSFNIFNSLVYGFLAFVVFTTELEEI